MKLLYTLVPALLLNGCIKGDPSPSTPHVDRATFAPKADRVYTVDEFLAEPELRKKFFTMCANNPGQTERDPNCINVLSAERIASAGTLNPHTAP